MKKQFLLGAIVLVGVVVLVLRGTSYSETYWIDPITASTKYETNWFGFWGTSRTETSELEQWLRKREPGYMNEWKVETTKTYGLLTMQIGDSVWPISSLQGIGVRELVRTSTDDELAEFIEDMRSEDQQRQVDAVRNAVLKVERFPIATPVQGTD